MHQFKTESHDLHFFVKKWATVCCLDWCLLFPKINKNIPWYCKTNILAKTHTDTTEKQCSCKEVKKRVMSTYVVWHGNTIATHIFVYHCDFCKNTTSSFIILLLWIYAIIVASLLFWIPRYNIVSNLENM